MTKEGHIRTPLGRLLVLPKLLNGKVVIVHPDTGDYKVAPLSRYATAFKPGFFDHTKYTLLQTPEYTCVVNATEDEMIDSNVKEFYQLYKSYKELTKPPSLVVGNRVHLKSKNGTYTVTSLNKDTFTITCAKWHGQTKDIPYSDFHCLAGGMYNHMLLQETKSNKK